MDCDNGGDFSLRHDRNKYRSRCDYFSFGECSEGIRNPPGLGERERGGSGLVLPEVVRG